MVRISDNGPAGNKAKRLSSVNHTTKTIHHHQRHQSLYKGEKKQQYGLEWNKHLPEDKKKNLLSIEKNIIKWKKIPYRIYKKLLF